MQQQRPSTTKKFWLFFFKRINLKNVHQKKKNLLKKETETHTNCHRFGGQGIIVSTASLHEFWNQQPENQQNPSYCLNLFGVASPLISAHFLHVCSPALLLLCVHVCSHFSRVLLFTTPQIIASQAPLFIDFFPTRILEWVARPSSRGSSQPRDGTTVFCTAGRFFTTESPGFSTA